MAIYGEGIGKCDKHGTIPEWDLGGRLYCPQCRLENLDANIEKANQEKAASTRTARVSKLFGELCVSATCAMTDETRKTLWDIAEKIVDYQIEKEKGK